MAKNGDSDKLLMNEETFKEKSIVKYKSPENLNEYIRVSNPRVWILLVSILILLVGILVWGIFGRIDSIVSSVVHVNDGTAVCYIDDDYFTFVNEGTVVKFNKYTGIITSKSEIKNNMFTCKISCETIPIDNVYDGKVILDSYKPISFVVN